MYSYENSLLKIYLLKLSDYYSTWNRGWKHMKKKERDEEMESKSKWEQNKIKPVARFIQKYIPQILVPRGELIPKTKREIWSQFP